MAPVAGNSAHPVRVTARLLGGGGRLTLAAPVVTLEQKRLSGLRLWQRRLAPRGVGRLLGIGLLFWLF